MSLKILSVLSGSLRPVRELLNPGGLVQMKDPAGVTISRVYNITNDIT